MKRRDFLRGSAAGVLGAGTLGGLFSQALELPATEAPELESVADVGSGVARLFINGHPLSVFEVSSPATYFDTIDVTSLHTGIVAAESDAKEFTYGIRETEVDVRAHFHTDKGSEEVYNSFMNSEAVDCRLILGGQEVTFRAMVGRFQLSIGIDEPVAADFNLRLVSRLEVT